MNNKVNAETSITQCAPFTSSPARHCDCYTDLDVLCVRGSQYHPGNQAFYAQANALYVRYKYASSLHEKLLLSHELVDSVHKRGGRFMTQRDCTTTGKEGCWVEIESNEMARSMARKVLRNPVLVVGKGVTTITTTLTTTQLLSLCEMDGTKNN